MSSPPPDQTVRSVLVVDDDGPMVRTLCDVLRRLGFDAHGVYSGEAALAAAATRPWSVVLMDIRMAGMTGVEALKALRRAQADLPVVLMTAYTSTEVLMEAIAAGVDRVLAKPVAPPILLAALESAVSGTSHVLLVDDNPAFLQTLATLLGAHGIQTRRAPDLEEACRQLRARAPRMIVLDLKLGQDDPRATVTAIRQAAPNTALIAYSAHADALAAANALPGAWFRAVLDKPILPERLLALLDDHHR